MKAMRRRLDRKRPAAGGVDAVTMGARDVSPRGGGLNHHVLATQRRRHCGISTADSLVCLLAASGGNKRVSICCGCADLGVGGGGASWRCVVKEEP